ncbi:MAG: class I SAM-dependent methyltransferase [Chloroflexi bacterium]|nr:class I SAM-dependent methyltransferase [Chloroflexota bacterium]
MIKDGTRVINKKGLLYVAEEGDKQSPVKFKPWLGDSFSALYDFLMKRFVFPRQLDADQDRHYEILGNELKDVHNARVLELATGSGSVVRFLPTDNQYTGTDISPGLLRKAVKVLRRSGFQESACYVARAEDLPFADGCFDVLVCILALNFFCNADRAFEELARVGTAGAMFFGCVPVPERIQRGNAISGTLYSEHELAEICEANGFRFESIPHENGALLYFRAVLQQKASSKL